MKPSLTNILIGAVLVCVMIAGMWFAYRRGIEEGLRAGTWQANVNSIAAILSSRALEEQGDLPKARKQIDDFLYFSASSLELNQDAPLPEEFNRSAGEHVLMQVAEYYWRNPDSYDINGEAKDSFLELVRDHHIRVTSILNRYKPKEAEQGGDGDAEEAF